MRFDVRTRYLARVYVDAASVANAAQVAAFVKDGDLADSMRTSGVLTVPVAEPKTPTGTHQRLAVVSAQGDVQLLLLSQTFDLIQLPIDDTGTNFYNFGEFAALSADVLARAADFFGRQPYRLALVQGGLMREMTEEQLQATAQRLLHLPAQYEASPPFEWDWRAARKGLLTIGERPERTNILTTIRRKSGSILTPDGGYKPFDRISVELDVNTDADDTRGRFNGSAIKQFFSLAVDEHSKLSEELTAFALAESAI